MAYCHECGEEVAEIDVFCPHCGISLQPVAVNDETDAAQERTIAISHSEIAETLGGINSEQETTSSPNTEITEIKEETDQTEVQKESVESSDWNEKYSVSVPPETDAGIDMKTDDSVNPATEENINAKTESVEIPASVVEPEIPQQTEPTPEEISAQPPTDDDWGAIPQIVNTPEVNQSESPSVDEMSSLTETEKTPETDKTEFPKPDFTGGQNKYYADFDADTGDIEQPKESETVSEIEDFVPEKTSEVANETESSMMSYSESEVKELNEIDEWDSPADSSAEVVETAAEEKVEETPVSENLNSEISAKSSVEDSPAVSFENAIEEKSIDAFPQESETPASESSQEDSFDSLEPPKVENVVTPEIPSAEMSEEKSLETVEDEAEEQIAKPDFEFEVEDETPAVSRFDSVRIMESREESQEENFEVQVNKDISSNAAAQPQREFSQPISQETEVENEERSYTTPNIGGSNTDGKKSKLKPLDEGTVLNGRYEIVRKIGGGGMGAVYLASDKNLGGVLRAVKEMVQSYIEETQQEKAVNDFKRESMLLTSLEHPAIPTIFDYFYDEKEARFYLVMKYINGGDLSSRLRSAPEGKVDERSVVEWAIQVADVLDYLHKRQPPIVYRDLKPANIMIDGNTGKIMLIDFGIARWINKEEKGVTAVGTMGYAPPELFSGNVEPRSDIYSLGSTMFHLLTGADPQSNPLLIFDFQKNPRPRQINPQLSDQIERILMRAVEYNAEKRFASAGEMRQELESHLDSLKGNQVTFGIKETPAAATLSDQKVFCGFCGQSIVASDLFCAFCGAKQPIAQKGVHAENYASSPMTAKLMILGTNELESPSYSIEKDENLVGRRDPMSNIFPEVDLSKFDPQTKISRRHARIWRDGNKFLVEDLGSSNGTILMPVINDAFRLVPNQPHILTNGDKLKLGDTTLHFVIG